MSESEHVKKVELNLDLRGMLEIANVGVRRAAAFMRMSELIQTQELPDNFAVGGGVAYSFWPHPLPEATKTQIKAEFQSWIIGSCLKELDQHFSLFLDEAWHIIDLAELHGTSPPSPFVVQRDNRFEGDTNSASKAKKLYERVGIELNEECLSTLSLARNALAHGLGQVRRRQINTDDDALEITWIGSDIVLIDGEEEIVFAENPIDMYEVKSPDGAPIELRTVTRSKKFPLDERVKLTQHDLAEICMFYSAQAAKLHNGLIKYLTGKGIIKSEESSTSNTEIDK